MIWILFKIAHTVNIIRPEITLLEHHTSAQFERKQAVKVYANVSKIL
jgi:hypothetical protein